MAYVKKPKPPGWQLVFCTYITISKFVPQVTAAYRGCQPLYVTQETHKESDVSLGGNLGMFYTFFYISSCLPCKSNAMQCKLNCDVIH